MRDVGTVVRGIRTGVIKENDDLANITVDSVIKASISEGFELEDKDIVAITEAVVGISMGNYATLDQISTDIKSKFGVSHIGVVYPILSRNRFAVLLSAIARSVDKITMQLSFPSDEVGNDILDKNKLSSLKMDLSSVISESEYIEKFGDFRHLFTGVNMVDFYREVAEKENCEIEFVFSNNPLTILDYTKNVLCADIHTREYTKKLLLESGADKVLTLSDIMTESVDGSGCNPKYGLLGSNRSTEERVKLFPANGFEFVKNVQKIFKEKTGKNIEVMIYGDGAFKDPIGGIWELADPVVSPGYTDGLEGSPNELKLKYLSDNKFSDLRGEELNNAIKEEIKKKDKDLKGTMSTQGTTPRRYTDLIGSLCDLTSGSGDKGTPVVLIQRYFTNYSE